MAAETETPTAYVNHHMTHLTVGHGFWSLDVDTLIFSVGLGTLLFFAMFFTARRATSGVPGRWQNFVELILNWIHDNVKQIFQFDNPVIPPLVPSWEHEAAEHRSIVNAAQDGEADRAARLLKTHITSFVQRNFPAAPAEPHLRVRLGEEMENYG